MEITRNRRVRLIILGLVGSVFVLHLLTLLTPLLLGLSALAGILVCISLLADIPSIRESMRKLFSWIERRLEMDGRK